MIDLSLINLLVTFGLIFVIVTTLFLIAKIWQSGVRRDEEKRLQ